MTQESKGQIWGKNQCSLATKKLLRCMIADQSQLQRSQVHRGQKFARVNGVLVINKKNRNL